MIAPADLFLFALLSAAFGAEERLNSLTGFFLSVPVTDAPHQMPGMNGTQLREGGVFFGTGGTLCVWRNSLKTLLVGAGCGDAMGLLPGRCMLTQGSTRQGSASLGCIPQPFQGWCTAVLGGE